MKPEGKVVWAGHALRMESMAVNQVLRTPSLSSLPSIRQLMCVLGGGGSISG